MAGGKPGGQPGNKNAAGGKRIKSYATQIIEADPTLMPRMLRAIAEKACEGDVAAFNAFCDRYDGKPSQSLDIFGDITTRRAEELSDAELAIIAAGRGIGIAEATEST